MSEKIEKSDIELWMTNPVTKYVMTFLAVNFDSVSSLIMASDTSKLWEIKGQNNVMYYVNNPINIYNELDEKIDADNLTIFDEYAETE